MKKIGGIVIHTQNLLLTLFFLLALLTGCVLEKEKKSTELEAKTFTEFYEKELTDVTKISVLDGSTGYSKTVTDKQVVDDFLDKIKDIQFIPDENQEIGYGFVYSIALYEDDKNPFIFSLNNVNDHYYNTKPEIYPIVDHFYINLEVEEK